MDLGAASDNDFRFLGKSRLINPKYSVMAKSNQCDTLSRVVLHPIGDLKTRLLRRLCVANARNSGAIAVPQWANPALIRRNIHRFDESHQE